MRLGCGAETLRIVITVMHFLLGQHRLSGRQERAFKLMHGLFQQCVVAHRFFFLNLFIKIFGSKLAVLDNVGATFVF